MSMNEKMYGAAQSAFAGQQSSSGLTGRILGGETPVGLRDQNRTDLGGRVNNRIGELNETVERMTMVFGELAQVLMDSGALTDEPRNSATGISPYSAPVSKMDARILEIIGRLEGLILRVQELRGGLTL